MQFWIILEIILIFRLMFQWSDFTKQKKLEATNNSLPMGLRDKSTLGAGLRAGWTSILELLTGPVTVNELDLPGHERSGRNSSQSVPSLLSSAHEAENTEIEANRSQFFFFSVQE